MFPDQDTGLGITAAVRAGKDLEQVLAELHGIVVGHNALVGEAANIVEDLGRGQGAIRGAWIGGRLGEARIVAGEEARQDRVGLLEGTRPRATQFADESAVEGAPQALDAAFGLRRGGGDPADAELLEGASELRRRTLEAAQLLGECGRMAGIAMEDAVPVAIDCDRAAGVLHHLVQNPEVSHGIFFVPKDRGRHFAGGVVDGATEGQAGPAAFEPVMLAGVELEEEPFLRHALAPSAMATGTARAGAGQAGGDQPAMDRPVGRWQPMVLGQGLGEVLVIEAGIGGPGQAQDPLLESAGEAIVRWPTAIAVGQGAGAVPAKGGQQAARVTQREAQQPRRIRRSHPTLPNLAQHLHSALFLLSQHNRPPVHTARVTESLLIQGVTESLLTNSSLSCTSASPRQRHRVGISRLRCLPAASCSWLLDRVAFQSTRRGRSGWKVECRRRNVPT